MKIEGAVFTLVGKPLLMAAEVTIEPSASTSQGPIGLIGDGVSGTMRLSVIASRSNRIDELYVRARLLDVVIRRDDRQTPRIRRRRVRWLAAMVNKMSGDL